MKNKKAILWSEAVKWIVIIVFLMVILTVIIAPFREIMFSKASSFFDFLRFGP